MRVNDGGTELRPFDRWVVDFCERSYEPSAEIEELVAKCATAALLHGFDVGEVGGPRLAELTATDASANPEFGDLVQLTRLLIAEHFMSAEFQAELWRRPNVLERVLRMVELLLVYYQTIVPVERWREDRQRQLFRIVQRCVLFGMVLWQEQPLLADRMSVPCPSSRK
jgi:hypothetical protein